MEKGIKERNTTPKVSKALILYQTIPEMSVKEICEKVHCSTSAVTKARNSCSIPKRSTPTIEQEKEILKKNLIGLNTIKTN